MSQNSRFKFTGTMLVEIPVEWSSDEPRTLHGAEEQFKGETGETLNIVRGRIAQAFSLPGNMSVKGQLVDTHHHTIITVKKESHGPGKAVSAGGNAGLRGPSDERGPDGHQAGNGPRTDQRDERPAGPAAS